MERQATQPAAVPSGRRRRRVSSKKQKREEEAQAQALELKATQPPTSELVVALDQMETQLNHLLYEACPFHPHQFIECVNPQTQFGQLRFKCPQEGCPVYLFEESREVMMEKLKEDTHPQVRARLQRGELRCKCGLVPKMKLSRTSKNYQKVFFSCGSFLPGKEPCAYFQWLHGPLWRPREQAQPTLRRWVKDIPQWMKDRPPKSEYLPIPLLKGKGHEMETSPPWEMHFMERDRPWFNQFAESAKAQERESMRKGAICIRTLVARVCFEKNHVGV